MSRQFSIPTVLRMTPNALLEDFFQKAGCGDLDIDWGRLGEREIEPVLKAVCDLPNDLQDLVAGALRTVFGMACESGIEALCEAVDASGGPETLSLMPVDANFYAKAMWGWLRCPGAFEMAARVHRVGQIRWWRQRNDLPRVEPDTSPAAIYRLQRGVSDMLLWSQGRGQICTVETMARGGTDYFFVYPDDFVRCYTAHDEDGRLAPRTIRPTFDIVFAYRRLEGALELFAKVPAKMKRGLERVFADCILGHDLGDWNPDPSFALDHLKHGRLRLETDPWDRLQVRIRRMRLALRSSGRSIWIGVNVDEPGEDIYRALAECLDQENVPLDGVSVTRATFTFDFLPIEGRTPGRSTFDVGIPNACTVRNDRPERVELVQKYLKRWKIDRARSAEPDLATA